MNLAKLYEQMKLKLDKKQLEILLDCLFDKALDVDSHLFLMQIMDITYGKKELYYFRRFIKSVSTEINAIVVDIYPWYNIEKNYTLYIFTINEIYSVRLNSSDLTIEEVLLLKKSPLGGLFKIVKKIKFNLLVKQQIRKFLQFYHEYELICSTFNIDYSNESFDYEKDFKKYYDEFYKDENVLIRKRDKEDRLIEMIQRSNYIDNQDYYKKLRVDENDLFLNSETKVYRHILLQRINKLENFVDKYIKYGLKTNYYDHEFIDVYWEMENDWVKSYLVSFHEGIYKVSTRYVLDGTNHLLSSINYAIGMGSDNFKYFNYSLFIDEIEKIMLGYEFKFKEIKDIKLMQKELKAIYGG